VWDTRDTLLGMHIGALPDAGAGEANAVLSPIQPVLDWFEVQAHTRHELPVMAAPSRVGPLVPPDEAHIDPADWQATIVAQTLWGEARGEGEEGMHAVGSVILNRLRRSWRGAATAADVCRAYKQFSCWNENDPNRRQLDRISREPDAPYHQAAQIARLVVARTLPDITLRATHYCVAGLRPPWVEGQSPCVVIGRHAFYNDIR
jgi:spore germination cell wall hydrolase CwlJ-like protein